MAYRGIRQPRPQIDQARLSRARHRSATRPRSPSSPCKFDYDYWDGSRETGYGGYKYDGRWRKVADAMVAAYGIKPGMRVLDVGSGKGFLLHDFTRSRAGRRSRRHRCLEVRRSSTPWRA